VRYHLFAVFMIDPGLDIAGEKTASNWVSFFMRKPSKLVQIVRMRPELMIDCKLY